VERGGPAHQGHAPTIIGHHFSEFYPSEARDRNWSQRELEEAPASVAEDEGWRLRKTAPASGPT
jgi:hypothetical protein